MPKIQAVNEEVTVPSGVFDKRLLALEPEFASVLRVMGREGSILSTQIRQAWDTGSLRLLTKNTPAKATGAHISIIGHVTCEELLRNLNSTEAGNGFGNRFLWVCVKRSKCLPEGGSLSETEMKSFAIRLEKILRFAKNVGEMRRDEEARTLWREVYPALSEGKPGLLGAVTSRAEAQVTRLSCLYALLDKSSVVKAVHLKAALALWKYCETSARCIFGESLGDPLADTILKALRSTPEGMTRTDIQNFFGRNRRASEIDQALGFLLEQGLAGGEPERTEGRPAERWFPV